MRGLGGKRVLISGGSSGIGLAAAARFLEEGREPGATAACHRPDQKNV
jgi:NAD(P)-dependent dehydrogenase (short-subunit alcohol dehydrogenase family)